MCLCSGQSASRDTAAISTFLKTYRGSHKIWRIAFSSHVSLHSIPEHSHHTQTAQDGGGGGQKRGGRKTDGVKRRGWQCLCLGVQKGRPQLFCRSYHLCNFESEIKKKKMETSLRTRMEDDTVFFKWAFWNWMRNNCAPKITLQQNKQSPMSPVASTEYIWVGGENSVLRVMYFSEYIVAFLFLHSLARGMT